MAGVLPGVEIHRRRRVFPRRLLEDTIGTDHRHRRSHRSWIDPPPVTAVGGATAMDESALRARRRLEEKLGYCAPSRHIKVQGNEGPSSSPLRKLLVGGRPWRSLNRKTLDDASGQLCAVCLEDLGEEQQMMELPCTHKYHSDCLLPWLASHSSCPSCRTPIEQGAQRGIKEGNTVRRKERGPQYLTRSDAASEQSRS